MNKLGPLYHEGHLIVAAVRVLSHKNDKPPTVEEVAELLGLSNEVGYLLARGLDERGIVRLMANPFDTHIELGDHLALEELPREDTGPGLKEDLQKFQEKKEKDREEMSDFFASGGQDKKKDEKLNKMEDEFKKFRKTRRGEDEDGEE